MKYTFRGLAALLLALTLSACSNFQAPRQGPLASQHQEHPELGFGIIDDGHDDHVHYADSYDPSAALQALDEALEDVVSSGPSAKVIKNLAVVGRGERNVDGATTDVWAHDGYAYLGTFNEPCGTGQNYIESVGEVDLIQNVAAPGIPVFDVHNRNKVEYVGNIPSVEGSRINDVKVASMNYGDILVHSNEPCDGGPGGFEIYDVSDPENPIHLAHVQTDDINAFLRENFGFTDFGVHNLYLFTREGRDYVAAQVEGLFGNFQIFDITDPTDPELVSAWGAESLLYPNVDWATTTDFNLILEANAYLTSGYGASANRFLHDFWVSDDGMLAYLANWDAGLVRLDLSNLSDPEVVSVALALESEDGEINSHSVWPSENGRIVVEGEEDFAPFRIQLFIAEGLVGIFDAAEASFTPPVSNLAKRAFTGETVYVGLACDATSVPEATEDDQVAVILRGVCFFSDKVLNVQEAGYAAAIIVNNQGDALLTPGPATPDTTADIPTIFVGLSTGLAIFGVDSVAELSIGMTGESARAASEPDGWSGFRIWDYSDPQNPVLASTFNTVCSANPLDASCDPDGIYSSHNVIVESQGNRVYAYFSWYADGMLVVDITNPYNPVEVARFDTPGTSFWGVYKEENKPWIYGSDRNGGLWIFKMLGQGTIGKK